MTIRQMKTSDYDQVHDLWMGCDGVGLNNIDDSRQGIDKFLKRNPTTCFVAKRDDKVIGTILAGYDGRRGYIYHLAVDPDFRNQGVGGKLVAISLKALEDIGCTKVALVVFNNNDLANDFWQKQGFEVRKDLTYRNKKLLK